MRLMCTSPFLSSGVLVWRSQNQCLVLSCCLQRGEGGQGPSLSLLWPPLQGDANECVVEVSHLAAHSGPVQGTCAAGVLPCGLRNFLSSVLLLMSSPL